ncbi:MAG: ABC transporter ATP-binding protein [Candidatus Latescibacteria bacterium]|nr:ABC transporter ATP-binding protein [Candidatus Latescibacterota bacterium]
MNGSDRDDEVVGKAYDSVLMRRLLRYLIPYKLQVAVSVVLLLGVSGLRLVGPYLTKIAIDTHIAHGDMAGLNRVGLLYVLIMAATFVLRYGQIYLTNLTGQRVMYDLRMAVYAHLQRLSLSFFDRNPVGRLITRVTNDIEALNDMFTSGVVTVFGDVFTLVGIMVAMITLDAKLALVSFAVLPVLFYAALLFRVKVRASYRQVRTLIARLNASLQESISGMSVTQLFNRQERNFEEFDRVNQDHRNARMKTIFYYALFFPAVEIISAIAIGLIIWYGGSQVIQGAVTLGALIAFIQYVQQFFQPISNLSEQYNTMQEAMASSERIFKLLDRQPEVTNADSPAVLPAVRGEIEFRHVWFAYQDEEWVLRDVSFRVQPGERVAFVGATGAGKTTIINLLCRFYDVQRGQILIDGVDIRRLDQAVLRRHIGLVLQDVFLFSGTIQENIRLWNEDIRPERVRQAAEYVNAHPFISRLPNEYQAALGERGSTLSVGQRQLLAFARALAYNPTILVLDEATSSIDTETELLIQDALEKLMAGRTSIVIAHRLSTVQNADQIIVLHKGQIQEVGTHQALLQRGGIYYKLYQLQYKDQEIRSETAMPSSPDSPPSAVGSKLDVDR